MCGEHHYSHRETLRPQLTRTFETGGIDKLVVDQKDVGTQSDQHLSTPLEIGRHAYTIEIGGARKSKTDCVAKGAVIIENAYANDHS